MPRIRSADHRILVLLAPAGRCLWGPTIAAEDEGWTSEPGAGGTSSDAEVSGPQAQAGVGGGGVAPAGPLSALD